VFKWHLPLLGRYQPGDWVVYCKTKFSARPGLRAKNVRPAPGGDDYCYTIDKYWVVSSVRADGSLVLRTRRGKEHVTTADDPLLRPARFWERWIYRRRFHDCAAVGGG
jgi:hypothetical protein